MAVVGWPPWVYRRRTALVLAVVGTVIADVGASDAPVVDASRCPQGYYRREILIFDCKPFSGKVYTIVSGEGSNVGPLRVPAGVFNAKISVESSEAFHVSIIVGGSMELMSSASSNTEYRKWGNSSVSYKQVGVSKGIINVFGVTPEELALWLNSETESTNIVVVSYSHDGVVVDMEATGANSSRSCPVVPLGCAVYDDASTRYVLYRWSAWAQYQYKSSGDAWEELCATTMRTISYDPSSYSRRLLSDGPVPFYIWPSVWSLWPDSTASSKTSWQSVFDLIDSLIVRDRYIDQQEFFKAYYLADVYPSLQVWCNSLRETYISAEDAYLQLAGEDASFGITFTKWQSQIWSKFAGFSWLVKAAPNSAFEYVDRNNNDIISESEIARLWSDCKSFNETISTMGLPIAGVFTTTSVPNLTRNYFAVDKCADIGHTHHLSKLQAAGALSAVLCCALDGLTCGSPSKEGCLSGRSHEQAEQACEGLGARLCSKAELETGICCGSGCDSDISLVWSSTTDFELNAMVPLGYLSSIGCMHDGVMYDPPLKTSLGGSAPNSLELCQEACASQPGCYYFSFQRQSSECTLHDAIATWFSAAGTISGPAQCTAAIDATIDSVEYYDLTENEKQFLTTRFVIDVAKALGLPPTSIEDESGLDRTLSLLPGGLVARSLVLLPPGRTIHDALAMALHSDLKSSLALSIAHANLSQIRTKSHSVISAADITIKVQSLRKYCFIEGTIYEPSMPAHDHVWASTPWECQKMCQETVDCAYFSFWADYKGCLLQDEFATPARNPNVSAGPRFCLPDPEYYSEPDIGSEEQVDNIWSYLISLFYRRPELAAIAISLCILPMALLCACSAWRRRAKRCRAPNSRPDEPDYHAVQTRDYSPMPVQGCEVEACKLSPRVGEGHHLSTERYASASAQFLHPQHLGYAPS